VHISILNECVGETFVALLMRVNAEKLFNCYLEISSLAPYAEENLFSVHWRLDSLRLQSVCPIVDESGPESFPVCATELTFWPKVSNHWRFLYKSEGEKYLTPGLCRVSLKALPKTICPENPNIIQ
jgi:hypothetical protein